MKTAAQTLRANPKLDVEVAITELGVGEALVSLLDAKGTPGIVERAFVLPPSSRIGPLSTDERSTAIKASLLYGHYEKAQDRESAYEKLKGAEAAAAPAASNTNTQTSQAPASAGAPESSGGGMFGNLGGMLGDVLSGGSNHRGRQTPVEAAVSSAARAIGSQVGRQIIRGVLGSILGGRSR